MQNLVAVIFAAIVAYNFGSQFGYQQWGVHDAFSAAFYGGGSMFMGAFIFGLIVVWPVVRACGNSLFGSLALMQRGARRKLYQAPAIAPENLDEAIRYGYVFSYDGLIDRDFFYTQGGKHRRRIRTGFAVQRNTATMSRREQEGVRIFETLEAEHLLGDAADRLRFALAWGDGQGEVVGNGKVTTDKQIMQQNGLKNFRDFVAAEAGHRDASCGSALSQLYTALQRASVSRPPSPGAVKLIERFKTAPQATNAGSEQWN